jgi:multisubunit Na+/H+ antiporter MnhC subunit
MNALLILAIVVLVIIGLYDIYCRKEDNRK